MFRKTVIVSVTLTLVLAAGFGIYYASASLPQTISSNQKTEKPLAKLVYTGTNETLSEALYHLDLQDGKLDEPHIVVTNLEEDKEEGSITKGSIIKRTVKFIDKNNKIKKEISINDHTKIWPEKNRKVMSVVGTTAFGPGPRYTKYYNVEGKILINLGESLRRYSFSPNGNYYVEWQKMYVQGPTEELRFYNLDGTLIGSYKYNLYDYSLKSLKFSSNGKYLLVEFRRQGKENQPDLLIFNGRGEISSKISLNDFRIETLFLSNSGSLVYLCGYANEKKKKRGASDYMSIIVVDKKGEIIFKKNSSYYDGFNISSNERYLAVTTREKIYVYDAENDFKEQIIDAGEISKKMRVVDIDGYHKAGLYKFLVTLYVSDEGDIVLLQGEDIDRYDNRHYYLREISKMETKIYDLGIWKPLEGSIFGKYLIIGKATQREKTVPKFLIYKLK